VCCGPVAVKDPTLVANDVARLERAIAPIDAVDGFITAVSPGTVGVFHPNRYYRSHEAYVEAVARAMRPEYEAIVRSGLLLQIDCPDLAMGRHSRFKDLDDAQFLRYAAVHVEALNEALADIPADRVRLHVCWGNYEGPHVHDLPLTAILPLLFRARVRALVIEGANPRHEHEWEIWKKYRLPDDKILVPGVIDTSTNYVEHPELVAQRIDRYASVVGRDRVMAGTDCGLGTFAGFGPVHPDIAWEKLRSLVAGARLASQRLWKPAAAAV
jgi:5-methyltetrahydropteroyltriglutamate--homocysteine methyltransferase